MECPRRVSNQDCSIFYPVQLPFIAVNVMEVYQLSHRK